LDSTTTPTTKKTNGISTRKIAEDVHAVTYGPEFLSRLAKELAQKGTFTVYYHSLPGATPGDFSHRIFFDQTLSKKTA
jgi:hypothetical protein